MKVPGPTGASGRRALLSHLGRFPLLPSQLCHKLAYALSDHA